jgi:hypothetical protein
MFVVNIHYLFNFSLLTTSLALAMLTCVSHANKASWIELRERKEENDWERDKVSEGNTREGEQEEVT